MHVEHTSLEAGARSIPVEIRVNRRAKRLILKVDPVRGCALITSPSKRAIPEALSFARRRLAWICAELDQGTRGSSFSPGTICGFQDRPYLIVNQGGPRARVRITREPIGDDPGEIIVGGDPAHTNRRMVDWLKKQAKTRLTDQVDIFVAALNVKRGAVTVRDTRSRWGSCASDGALSFSWRLILAPPWILDYVAAHECAHLIHMDHSPAFWDVVRTINPDAKRAIGWFREHGERLHAYGVEAASTRAA